MSSNYKSAVQKIITVQEAVNLNLLQLNTSFVYMDESFNTTFYTLTDLPILPSTPLHETLIEELKSSLSITFGNTHESLNTYILIQCNLENKTILPKNTLFLKPDSNILIIHKP